MSSYLELLQRLRDDAEFRAALEAADSSEARADVVRRAGLELPAVDDVLQGIAGGGPFGPTMCNPSMTLCGG